MVFGMETSRFVTRQESFHPELIILLEVDDWGVLAIASLVFGRCQLLVRRICSTAFEICKCLHWL